MGQCKYCGEDAGFFSHVHKECEEKHNQGVSTLEGGIRKYLKDALKISDLLSLVVNLKKENYLTDPDIAISHLLSASMNTRSNHVGLSILISWT